MVIAEIIQTILLYLMIFGPPAAVFIWFVVSLVLFLRTPKEEHEKREKRKFALIISGILTAVLIIAIIGLTVLISMAIANM